MLKDTKANKIFLIALIGILAILFSSNFFWQKHGKENRSEETYAISSADSVKISTVNTDIVLVVDPKAKGALVSVGQNDRKNLKAVKNGKELSIVVSPLFRGFLNFFNNPSTPLVVTLPQVPLDQMEIKTTSGDILFMQDFSSKGVQISSISGDIDMLNLTGITELSVKTISGDVSGYSARSEGLLTLASTSGNLEVDSMEGATVSLHVISGDIEGLVHILPQGSLDGSTTSGRLSLDLSKSEDLDIRATRISGTILFNNQRQELSPALASTGAKNTKVKVSTVSGDLHIKF